MPKIIVGIDESDRSKDAVALAAQLARGSGAELVLVCAYPYDDMASRVSNAEWRRSLEAGAFESIRRAQEEIADLPVIAPRAIAEMSPAKAIQATATSERASLIVIGSSHRGALGRVLAGTSAERLLHGAPCPVAVAPTGFHADEDSLRRQAIDIALLEHLLDAWNATHAHRTITRPACFRGGPSLGDARAP